jgi:serine/threonine protein kinase
VPAVASADQFLDTLKKSGLLSEPDLAAALAQRSPNETADPNRLARRLVQAGLLTSFQAGCLLQGKWRNLIVSNKYKILNPVGEGGMGQVFVAEHLLMKRQVALKILSSTLLQDGAMVDRFIREARALAALDHPNIVRAYDLDQFGKAYVLIMEYVDGPNLRNLVAAHGARPVAQAALYTAQAAEGLQHAHEAGWVHRDVKPANLLVDPAGVVKVLDLGLAFLWGDDRGSPTRQFEENGVLGTADYLAPEQAIDSHAVDIRADVYSLGATLYFLLTGRPPFECATVAQKLLCHQMKEPTPVREVRAEVPAGLAAILAKMMAKKPEDRYQTPAEVAAALLPFAEGAEPLPPAQNGKAITQRRSMEPSVASTLNGRTRTGKTTFHLGLPRRRNWGRLEKGAVVAASLVVIGGMASLIWAGLHPKPNLAAAAPATAAPAAAQGQRKGPKVVSAGERKMLIAHEGASECVRVLGDGLSLLTSGGDKTVRVWDLNTGKQLKQLEGHTDTARCIALFPDNVHSVITSSRDGTLRLWDMVTGTEQRRYEGHEKQVWWADVSPDGKRLLSCGQDKTIRLWDVKSGVEVRQLLGHEETVTGVAFLPGGKRAVSCSTDKTARLWDVPKGAELKSITLPATAYRLALAPDGRRVAVGSGQAVHVWDVETDKVTAFEATMDRGFIEEGRFSPDGRWLLAGGSDGSLHLWDVASAYEQAVVKGMNGKILEVWWVSDSQSFWTAGEDGTVRLWELAHVTGGTAKK